MNMSVRQFVQAPAIVARSRSVWHEIIDTMMEGPPRTAADEIAEYLARHPYDLSPTLRQTHDGQIADTLLNREIISEWKNWCVVTVGQSNAAANRT